MPRNTTDVRELDGKDFTASRRHRDHEHHAGIPTPPNLKSCLRRTRRTSTAGSSAESSSFDTAQTGLHAVMSVDFALPMEVE